MTFTAGYKVNEDTQYEFTVSNETLSEVVQDGGITDGHLAEYCYSALYDTRVYKLMAAQGNFGWPGTTGGEFASMAKATCPGIVEGWSSPMTSEHPAFNKELLDSTDQVYQRNFLVWNGTIYPGTENEKHGDFLVMDIKDIKRWYVNFDNNGFGETDVTSSIGETPPEGYVWPGYTGHIYTYISNVVGQAPVMHCDNNNPQLNPNTNIRVRNILIINDECWVGSFNPSTHCNDYMGGSGCAYAGKSLYGFYWNGSSNGGYLTTSGGMDGTYYQRGTLDFMGLPDYSNAPELPGAPRNDIGSLNYSCYAVTNSDNLVVNLAGNWGQQNYASGVSFVNNSSTTQLTSILKWQSWCGLKFQYNNTMYKPIIEGGIVVGYSDDMDAESEYDDMTNVTGNNIPSTPPAPPQPDPDYQDDPWSNIGAGLFTGTAGAFAAVIALSNSECESLAQSLNSVNVPTGFDPMPNILGMKYFPFDISGSGTDTTVQFSIRRGISTDPQYEGGGTWNTGVSCRVLSSTTTFYDLGYVDIPNRMSERGYPFADYKTAFEAYIPFCGVFPLNADFIMGRRLKATLYVDVMNGTCTGVIYAYNGTALNAPGIPVAMGGGVCSVDVPVSSSNYGMANANFIGSAVKGVFAVGTAIVNSKSGNVAGTMTSAWEAGTRFYRSQVELANNLTSSTGFGGDQSSFFLPPKAYVKIVRPRVARDGNYARSHAYPVCTNGSLRGHGFCIAVNPDLASIQTATDSEKAEMYQLITTGVYT